MSESSKFNVLAVNWFQYDDCISDSSVDLADVLVSVDKYDYIVYAHNNMIIHFKREQIEQYVAKRDGNYVVSSYNEPKKTKSVGVAPWRCLEVEKNVKSMKLSCDSTLIGIIYDDYSLEIISLPSLINQNTKFCVYKNDDKDFISMEWNPDDDTYLLLIRNNGIYLHNVISRKMKQIDEANNSYSNISWFNKSTFFASHNNNIKKFTFENNSLDSSVTNEEVTITVEGFVVTEIKGIKGLSDNIIEVLALIQDDDYKVLLLLRHHLVDGTSENMLPYDYPENPDEKNIFYMRYLEKIKVLVVGNNYSPEKIELSYPASYAMIVDIVQHDESSVADSGETNMYRHLSKMNHPNDEINKKVCGMCVLNNCIRLKNGQHDGFLILVLFSDGKLLVSLCETNATQGHYARVEEVSKTIPYKEFVPGAKEIQEIVDITDDDESVVVHEERNIVNITIDSLNNELIELETLSRSIESKLRCFEWIQAANAATKDICDSHSPELESLLQRNNHNNIVSGRWKSASISSSSAGVGGDSSQDKINRRWHKLVDQASSHETMKESEIDVANIYSKKKENPATRRLLIDGKKNKTTPKSAEKKDIAKEVKVVTKEVVKESKTVSFGQIAPLALDLNKATPTSMLQGLGAVSATDTKVADASSLLSVKSPAAASITDTKVADAFSSLSVKSPAAVCDANTKVADAFLLSSKGPSNAFTALQVGKVDSQLGGFYQTESVPQKQTVATKKVDEVAPVSAVIDKQSTDAVKVADSAKSVVDADTPVLSEEEKIVSEIKELYKRYNADKVGEVDTLVKKYGPNELLQKIKAKYERDGKNTAQATEAVSTTASTTTEAQSAAKDTPSLVKAESPSRPTTIPSLPVSSVKPLTGTPKTDDIKPLPLPLGAFDIRKQNTEAVKFVADTPVLSEEEKIINEIKELFKRYNADKLGEVDTLLKKYKPSELLQKIKAKYEKDGSNSTTPTNTMSGITAPQSGAKGALSLMKTQSSPSNASTMSPWGVGAVKTQSPSGPTTGTSLFGQQSQLGMGQQPLLTRTSSNPMSSTPSNPMSSTPSFGNTSPVVYGGGGGGVFGANTNTDEAIINEIKELFKRYNADKLGEVDTLLKKYKPSELLQKIKAKYEKDGSNSTTPTNTMSGGVSTGQQWGSATSSLFRPNSSPSGPTTGTSLFGQQSQLVMGQQPLLTRTSSNPMSSTPSFGNTSPVVYGGGGVFGANTSNGQSSFGQVSQIGSSSPGRVGVFGASLASNNQSLLGAQGGQPLYGQTSQPSQSLFGSRSLPNTNGQVFGQTSSLGSTNTFGQSGQSSWLGNR